MTERPCTPGGRVLVIGHSHTYALSKALVLNPEDCFQIVNLNALENTTALTSEWLLQLSHPDYVISMVGGNAYYTVALLEHPQPFDVLV